ncbi:universal stress protein [Nitrosopumilus cobalaminigenes]|uniref:Universal stress protein n=1 Tax=Nitrosopumilus cobalaminigenes TaxID=1470066 RepID=A0A7D5R085_9ARCH|nr:universal stress protein [Nitrosopumilus cobalaminigenes]QLH02437.1 universal stress protein [Nitrosopumilus cobalaminigenes]
MMKTFEHILVPHNGTKNSETAFKKALALASLNNAKITVITCLEERNTFGFFKTKTSKQEFEKERKIVEKQHSKLEKIAKEYNISCSSKITKNELASTRILEFAKQHKVDLIVIKQTKISSRYEKQYHHSTVENIFRNASCPVLIL